MTRRVSTGLTPSVLRLPPPAHWVPPEGWGDEEEFEGHLVACLWRMTAVEQSVLERKKRVARLSEEAQRMLIAGLIQVVSPLLPDPSDDHLPSPDMSSSWSSDD